MKKLGCAKCGGVKKMQKGGTKKRNPFEPQVVSKKDWPANDKGDNSDNYKYPKKLKKQQKGGMIFGIPNAGQTGPNRTAAYETMQAGGAKEKRAERKITKQIKKSVMNSGKVIKAKRGGIKK